MRDHPIVISELDARVLRGLLAAHASRGHDQDHLEELSLELERAQVLKPEQVDADVVTMHRPVRILDVSNGVRQELTLVGPAEANVSARRISVLAPLGTALLGYRVGDEVEWLMPGGVRRIRIESVKSVNAGTH